MKKYILSGLIALGIMVGCFLPPILHFVTGPLGPIIGGFAGGMKAKADGKGAWIIGLIMGTGITLLLGLVFTILATSQLNIGGKAGELLQDRESLPVLPIVMGAFMAITLMGSFGAFLGGKLARKAEE